MSLYDRWLYACKPGSWPKLLVPLALGQAVGIASVGRVNPLALFLGLAFVLLFAAGTVLLNDYGDQEVDALKRRLFPEACSPKTIPDDILEAKSVLWAGTGAFVIAIGIALSAEIVLVRPGLTLAALSCVLLFLAYTFPPVQLNYRGGGEILEMIGVGFALPWWCAYLQSGQPSVGGLVLLPGFTLMSLSSALASGLADVQTDRLGGKRTFATMFGTTAVRQAIDGLVLGSLIFWAMLPILAPSWATSWMMIPAVMTLAQGYRRLRKTATLSDIETFQGLRAYKGCLHQAIWRAALLLSAIVAIWGLLAGGIG